MTLIFSSRLRRTVLAVSIALGALSAAGSAYADSSVGVRGAITALDGDTLKVHTNGGEDLSVNLTPATVVRGITLAQLSDIKPGSYVGSAAMPQADGTLMALEVHVFPPEMAGTGDGNRPFDLAPNSSMTNGSVGDLVTSNGRTMTVKYKGGEKKIVVPDDVPIVNIVPGDRSLLKPGVKIVMRASRNAEDRMTALSISAGKDGVTPPM